MIYFRTFTENDWSSFEEIVEEAFARENILKENFLQILDDEGLVGAFREEKLVGYVRLMIMEEYGHLAQIAVEKSERGKGYGNKLMEYAIEYFNKREVESTGLYVETNNSVAISLYEKYDFRKKFESFHYWINEEDFVKILEITEKLEDSVLRILTKDDFDEIVEVFPNINTKELKVHLDIPKSKGLSGGESIPLGLFVENKLQVYGRFNPKFPGCRPFLVTDVKYVDHFIKGLSEYKEENYVRLTFDRDVKLSEFFAERGHRLHHHLYMMERRMKEREV